ncbi:branched-chain amino acid ABC transporter permease [Cognatishimia sp. 1_MG-2023]|uniref:branched-chain amino acid ABC transporter permease n=1 Tax=Cognatishimia sp. 1_MG-2023 TaxID=3062642 RepID=UPI0026E2C4DE|nr:branched-chain amino acid ABC transporter permease [Cognatishimia sp. 1_MG-2023]MDO6727964.1 branched-chain amino acid ABC transporter permease [Cognatishimia sp. 1_MG-2023]
MLKVYGLFLVSGLAVGSLYALAGIGLVILRRSTGFLNFAYGALAAAAAMVAWQVADWGAWGPIAWLSALLTGVILSVAYGRIIAPSLAWREPAVKAVATLGYMLILLGVMGLLWDDELRKLSLPTDKMATTLLGVRVTVTRMIALGLSVAAVIAMILYLDRSRMGLNMRALADDRDHAALLGIPIVRVETIAWCISGALAGVTGLLFGSLVRLEPTVITFMVIPATAAAIVGRLNSLPMTLLGGLLIGVVEAMLTLYKPLAPLRAMTPFVIAGLVILWMQRGTNLTFATKD